MPVRVFDPTPEHWKKKENSCNKIRKHIYSNCQNIQCWNSAPYLIEKGQKLLNNIWEMVHGIHVEDWKNDDPCKTNDDFKKISQHVTESPSMSTRKVQDQVQDTQVKIKMNVNCVKFTLTKTNKIKAGKKVQG